ncbi:hypothetical protein [Burkholderia cepacia]|uniref:hypothetical protein n=1 Tax=Burkholderia cepacia TaxID=292 RepID=UPI002AB65D5B|nr:hypothetical protein [Burkholderia cepacia]
MSRITHASATIRYATSTYRSSEAIPRKKGAQSLVDALAVIGRALALDGSADLARDSLEKAIGNVDGGTNIPVTSDPRISASRCAVAAIKYALDADEGLTFLTLWLHGDFSAIRREWPDAPETVFPEVSELCRPEPETSA